jgi:mono/diheme cytochrome c family protein
MSSEVIVRGKAFHGMRYLIWHALLLATCWVGVSNAADRSAEGKAILHKHCGRCHAIEAAGDSPLKTAPPMRDIYRRFATRELQQELSEGMVSKHKEMPQISFSDEDVAAILAYLYDLARKK